MPGDTVGVMDWDSHRFLEAFFAIPMMGAVLQTVNVRLSPEQIAYTIDHAGASTLLVNDEFVGLLEGSEGAIAEGQAADRDVGPAGAADRRACPSSANMRACSLRLRPTTTSLISTRTPRRPPSTRPARPDCPRGSITAIANSCCTRSPGWRFSAWRACRAVSRATTSTCRSRRCSTSMPGAFPGRRRSPASSRSIPDATSRRCWSS